LDNLVGKVVHYYDKLGVAIIDLDKGGLKVGDEVKLHLVQYKMSMKY